MTHIKSSFIVDDLGPYEGYHDPAILWNGWNNPSFTLEVVKTITNDLMKAEAAAGEQHYTYTWDGDILVITVDQFMIDSCAALDYVDLCKPYVATIDNKQVNLYSLHNFEWCWQEDFSSEDAPVNKHIVDNFGDLAIQELAPLVHNFFVGRQANEINSYTMNILKEDVQKQLGVMYLVDMYATDQHCMYIIDIIYDDQTIASIGYNIADLY